MKPHWSYARAAPVLSTCFLDQDEVDPVIPEDEPLISFVTQGDRVYVLAAVGADGGRLRRFLGVADARSLKAEPGLLLSSAEHLVGAAGLRVGGRWVDTAPGLNEVRFGDYAPR